MRGPDGQLLDNRVFTPQQIYRSVRGIAPDLIVYFGNLAWRSVGTVGGSDIFTAENDTGPDDANHSQYGMFIYYDPKHRGNGKLIEGAQIYDILPTLLTRYNLQQPPRLRGKVLGIVS
jgi:predicted AlkP superfamily phosphohydrolase/phosphomutase